MSDWISANTHPPKYGYYITWDGMNVREALWKSDHWSGIRFYDRIIHWKCLPPPPEKKHYCENPYMRCYTDLPNYDVLFLQTRKEIKEHVVTFCPICGGKA